MITKTELTDLIIERLAGGPVTDHRKYHPEMIGKIVDVVLNSIIAQDVEKAEITGGVGIDSDWIQTINKIPIKFDSSREQCYIEWSVDVLLLNTRGVREINWPVTETDRGFNIMPSGSYQVFADLESSDIEGSGHIAIIEGKRVYFPQMSQAYATKKRKLMAKVILAAAAYDEDDILPIPEGRMAEALATIDQLTAGLRVNRIKVSNDSNPNTI